MIRQSVTTHHVQDTWSTHGIIYCIRVLFLYRRTMVGAVTTLIFCYLFMWQQDAISKEIASRITGAGVASEADRYLILEEETEEIKRNDPEIQRRASELLKKKKSQKSGRKNKNGVFIPNLDPDTAMKTIILWTTQYGKDTWSGLETLGREAFYKYRCPVHACNLTRDRSLLDKASMLVFFYDDSPDYPQVRDPKHLYVHTTHEPPGVDQIFLKKFDGQMNLTMNYRLDADIPYPYQHFIPLPPDRTKSGPYQIKTPVNHRNRSVVWPVSNCGAPSLRDDYVKELSKYIDVAIIGKCGNLTCERKIWNTCYFEWEKHYKFYLAFENNYCKDYVTEKLFGTLSFEIIPVTFGYVDYSKVAPPHSVIDVSHYKSPQELADYLHHLADNPDEYNKYFQWKQGLEIEDGYTYKRACRLCEAAHNKNFTHKPAHEHYSDWFLNACNNDIVNQWSKNW